MSLKKAAEDLLKLADDIEMEAAKVTTFVCAKCNHTTTLDQINAKRSDAAKQAGEDVTVSDITVNDKVSCPACEGVLSYKETEASMPYYFEPKTADDSAEEVAEKEEKAKKEEKEAAAHSEEKETAEQEAAESLQTQKEERAKGKHASIDYDQLERYTKA